MKIDCSQVDSLKEVYVDGLLPSETTNSIEAHAAECDMCRERISTARMVKGYMPRAVKSVLGHKSLTAEQVSTISAWLGNRATRPVLRATAYDPLPALFRRPAPLMGALATLVLGVAI